MPYGRSPIAHLHGVTSIDEVLNGTAEPGAPGPFLSHLTDINAQVGWGVILDALAAALAVAVLASAATTWMIGRIQPAEALRSE